MLYFKVLTSLQDHMNLLDYVGVVEVLHLAQQRHLADHEGGDPRLRRVSADDELLHRQEALLVADLSGFVHLPVGALSHLCQQLVAQTFTADVHCLQDVQINLNLPEKRPF